MQASPGSRARLWPEDIRKTLQYQLSLVCPQSGEILARARAEKYFLSQSVRRLEVRQGPVRGVLFLPPRPGPAIITMYGGTNRGKVPEDRSDIVDGDGGGDGGDGEGGVGDGNNGDDLTPDTCLCPRAALLASYGYVSLALAYYGVSDLPSLYESFNINYFQLAVDWLLAQPQVTSVLLSHWSSSNEARLSLVESFMP